MQIGQGHVTFQNCLHPIKLEELAFQMSHERKLCDRRSGHSASGWFAWHTRTHARTCTHAFSHQRWRARKKSIAIILDGLAMLVRNDIGRGWRQKQTTLHVCGADLDITWTSGSHRLLQPWTAVCRWKPQMSPPPRRRLVAYELKATWPIPNNHRYPCSVRQF